MRDRAKRYVDLSSDDFLASVPIVLTLFLCFDLPFEGGTFELGA